MGKKNRLLRGIESFIAFKTGSERSRRARNDILVILLLACISVVVFFMVKSKVEQSVSLAAEKKEPNANKRSEDPERKQKQQDPNLSKALPPDHNHPAFNERIEDRDKMVKQQIRTRDVNDPNVLKAMRTVPRHAFVRDREQRLAYGDYPLPIGFGQTISQPYIVAFMTQALQLKPGSKVLEIGTGSGYQAAVCAEIAQEVYTIEIVEELAKIAKERLAKLGYRNVFVRAGDGYFGWPEKAPFDAIIGTAAAGRIPEPLVEQLKQGGRMILPVEGRLGFQYLVLITKGEKGNLHKKNVMPVRFVPMTGEVQKNP